MNLGVNMLPMTFPGQAHGHTQAFKAPDDLPKTVARTLSQGSSPMSMDFHPIKQTLLLGLFPACDKNHQKFCNIRSSLFQFALFQLVQMLGILGSGKSVLENV